MIELSSIIILSLFIIYIFINEKKTHKGKKPFAIRKKFK